MGRDAQLETAGPESAVTARTLVWTSTVAICPQMMTIWISLRVAAVGMPSLLAEPDYAAATRPA